MKKNLKISKEAKKMADDLGLNDIDAFMMELKSKLYKKGARLIQSSELTHEQIASLMGTSRSRISRIANYGENNISIEVLIKLIAVLDGQRAIQFAA